MLVTSGSDEHSANAAMAHVPTWMHAVNVQAGRVLNDAAETAHGPMTR